MEILIQIKDKIAKTVGNPMIVCHNSDYALRFEFDEHWEGMPLKTARFCFMQEGEAKYIDTPFSGDRVAMPTLGSINGLLVGVYAGDLQTTTPAYLPCTPSIRQGSPAPAAPEVNVYDQIIALINAGVLQGPQGEKGEKGDTGAQGMQGRPGENGANGVTPVFSIGTVETLEADAEATASITGSAEAPVLNLGIPKGTGGGNTMSDTVVSISATGADDDVNILAAIASLPENGGTVRLAPGDYYISSEIAFDKDYVQICGSNILAADATTKTEVNIYGTVGFKPSGKDFRIHGVNLINTADARSGSALNLSDSTDETEVTQCRFDGWGTGVYTCGSSNGMRAAVRGCVFHDCTVGVSQSTNTAIADNMFTECITGIGNPNACDIHNNTILDCDVGIGRISNGYNTITGNIIKRGEGTAADYTDDQHTILVGNSLLSRVFYGNRNYIVNNKLYGKDVTIDFRDVAEDFSLEDLESCVIRDNLGIGSWNNLTDRPFGETVAELAAVHEITGTIANGDYYIASFDSDEVTGNEEALMVTFDGIAYTCYATPGEGSVVGYGGLSAGGEEPFSIVISLPPESIKFVVVKDQNPHTLSISGLYLDKLDEKFIPDTVARTADVPSGSWNDLTDKPFGEIYGDTLTWEINEATLDFESLVGDTFAKVSDAIVTEKDLANGFAVVVGGETMEVPAEAITKPVEGVLTMEYAVFFVDKSGVGVDVDTGDAVLAFNESGVYLPLYLPAGALTIPGYTCFKGIHPLDEQYLPNKYLPRTEYVQSDWTQADETAMDFIKNKPKNGTVVLTTTTRNGMFLLLENDEAITHERLKEICQNGSQILIHEYGTTIYHCPIEVNHYELKSDTSIRYGRVCFIKVQQETAGAVITTSQVAYYTKEYYGS